ncbi:MAG: tetratricopeptide repeat protein [Blastocatellia bacterium]
MFRSAIGLHCDPNAGTFGGLGFRWATPFAYPASQFINIAFGNGYAAGHNWAGTAGYTQFPYKNSNTTFDFYDNLSKVMGSHTIKAGIYVNHSWKDQAAIEQIAPTVSLAPPDAAVLYGLGLAHLCLGRAGFRAVLERLASFPGGKAALHYLQGQAFFRDRQFEQALEELRLAVQGDPALPRLSFTLGLTCLQLGKPREAIPPLTEAVEREPGNLAALYHLADACQREGREEEALSRLDQALRLDPGAAEVEGLKGRILQRLGRTAEALGPLERAAHRRPDDPELRYALARLYQQLGRRTEAAREFAAVQRLKAAQLEADRQATPRSPSP